MRVSLISREKLESIPDNKKYRITCVPWNAENGITDAAYIARIVTPEENVT